jgi:hypothetical protein
MSAVPLEPAYSLRELEDDIERLIDELHYTVRVEAPDSYVDPVKVLDRDSSDDGTILVRGLEIEDVHGSIDAAFDAISWSLQRIFRRLRNGGF